MSKFFIIPVLLRLVVIGWCLTATGCGSNEMVLRIPVQRRLPIGVDPPPFGSFLDFGADDGLDYIIRDIDAGGAARWTRDHPEMQFNVEFKPSLHLVVDFIVVAETFRSTGPVTLIVKVNDSQIGSMRCDRAGEYHFEKPVPRELIKNNTPTRVTAEASPVWVSPSDGAHLGYLILRAGFRW